MGQCSCGLISDDACAPLLAAVSAVLGYCLMAVVEFAEFVLRPLKAIAGELTWRAADRRGITEQRSKNPDVVRLVLGGLILAVVSFLVAACLVGSEKATATVFGSVIGETGHVSKAGALAIIGTLVFSVCGPIGLLLHGEYFAFIAGFVLGWIPGAIVSLLYECLVIVLLWHNAGSEAPIQLLDYLPGARRLAAKVGVVLHGRNGTSVGIVLGFVLAPAIAKDCVAALVLRVPLQKLLVIRLPSAAFFSGCLAFFGHRAWLIATMAFQQRDQQRKEISTLQMGGEGANHTGVEAGGLIAGQPANFPAVRIGDEVCFGFVVAGLLCVATAYAHRELALMSADVERQRQKGSYLQTCGGTSGFGPVCWTEDTEMVDSSLGLAGVVKAPANKDWTPLRLHSQDISYVRESLNDFQQLATPSSGRSPVFII